MFGCPASFINNNMFAGVHRDFIILRLSEADRNEIKAKYDEVGQFEPFEGRPMKEYIGFPDWLSSDRQEFMDWLSPSYEFANKLPPKVKKPKKKKKVKS
jgi:TfoX/Sxy family transcriptional regulator of competence genes